MDADDIIGGILRRQQNISERSSVYSMAQHWHLYNIDKTQYFRYRWLGEGFFSRYSSTELIYHLVAPVIPPFFFDKNEWLIPRLDSRYSALYECHFIELI